MSLTRHLEVEIMQMLVIARKRSLSDDEYVTLQLSLGELARTAPNHAYLRNPLVTALFGAQAFSA